MQQYIHNRYKALVLVNEKGKKTIIKHNRIFKTFNELAKFEETLTHAERRKGAYTTELSDKELVDMVAWLKGKGE